LCETAPVYAPLPNESSGFSVAEIAGISVGAVVATVFVAAAISYARTLWDAPEEGYERLSTKEHDDHRRHKKGKEPKAKPKQRKHKGAKSH
jgi:hypothetical protein